MSFTPENVESAIQQFYANSGKLPKDTHEWLTACQQSREGWSIVWPLLDPRKEVQVQFLAAGILHHKVTKCLGEIGDGELSGLKDRLVGVVAKYVGGPSMVLTRLCLSLGSFVVYTIGTHWTTPLEDLATTFAPQNFPGVPESKVMRLLVEVFEHIPEQASQLTSVSKGQAYRELQSKGHMMYEWLFNVVKTKMEGDDKDLVHRGFKALSAWMKMIHIFEWPELFPFIDLTCNIIVKGVEEQNEDVCDSAIEVLSAIAGEPQAHQYPSIMLQVLDKLIAIHPSINIIKERDDMELASTFYGMYVCFADCHSRLVVEVFDPECPYALNNPKNRDNALMLIKILLECTDYPGSYPTDEIVSSMTISVWYSLVEDIQAYQSDRAKYVGIMQVFEEVYQTLAKILIKKAQYPAGTESWTCEEQEMFRTYRQDVCDCLTYCFELRGWTMLNELIDWTEANLNGIESNPAELVTRWNELESLLLGIRAVSENISDETDPVVAAPMGRVFSVIYRVLKLNREASPDLKNPKLFQAAIECISACSGMLHLYDSVAKSIVGFILEGLLQPEIKTSATLALKTLSRDCTKSLSEFTPQILTSCKQALDSGLLSTMDCNRIVFCIGRFLPFLPPEQLLGAINEIFAPCLAQLQGLVVQGRNPELKSQLVGLLNVFSTLCLSLDATISESDEEEEELEVDADGNPLNNNTSSQPVNHSNSNPEPPRTQPIIPVVEQILPVLIPVAENWARDEETMDALFSIVKHTLSTIHSSSMTVLQYAMQLVLISFRLHPFACATNSAKQTILMLGKENRSAQQQFLAQMHGLYYSHPVITDPEFQESYLQFLGQLIKTDAELVGSAGLSMEPIVSRSIEALDIYEYGLVKAAIFLLTNAIDKSAKLVPPLSHFFRNEGHKLVHKMLHSIGTIFPRSQCQHFGDLVLAMNRNFAAEWRKWLTDALQIEGFPSPHVNQEQKQKFFIKVTKERVNKRAIQEAITEFAQASRNISGTDYAAATSKRL